jgi:hypothetical protein
MTYPEPPPDPWAKCPLSGLTLRTCQRLDVCECDVQLDKEDVDDDPRQSRFT